MTQDWETKNTFLVLLHRAVILSKIHLLDGSGILNNALAVFQNRSDPNICIDFSGEMTKELRKLEEG